MEVRQPAAAFGPEQDQVVKMEPASESGSAALHWTGTGVAPDEQRRRDAGVRQRMGDKA